MPSLGYIPGTVAPGDFRPQADALRKAMKGFGTDEKALIAILAPLDPLQVAAVRSTFSNHLGRDLMKDVKSETSGYFEAGLVAVIEGPLMHDVESVHSAIDGLGTKEWLLNDVLLGRSNADMNAIKTAYEMRYRRSLARDVADDLSFGTSDLFAAAIRATRNEESMPVNPQTIEADIRSLSTKNVKDVCAIFARSSDAEIRAISQTFESRYNESLEKHIERKFSGHMEDALLHMLRTATDPAMRDAILLEECMSGMGTKDQRLVVRVVRAHWDRNHKEKVKRAYHHKFRKNLVDRVRGETSGDYGRLMAALLES
jgi:annexin A7/11